MRRLVLIAAALGMLAEAVLIAVALFVVGRVIGAYSMSMNGANPAAASVGVQVLAFVVAATLFVVALFLVVAAARDRPLTGFARWLTIAALVVQWILAVITAVTSGGIAFALALAVAGCLTGALLADQRDSRPEAAQRLGS
jgi:heme A synthase